MDDNSNRKSLAERSWFMPFTYLLTLLFVGVMIIWPMMQNKMPTAIDVLIALGAVIYLVVDFRTRRNTI